ncbi:uncharacterized protein F4812DRAFT_470341 [Daldinia caldariorum]|uniref:uncharacterized protein n=1 Tax=Daldinia caldariorum TaxID=326644 RepID=UPI002008E9A0|nr:uncharacterized protein F4812DRAFT_470341 [Daldinia caldariorum]KAI1469337.1 hypothetical protein F4812DRAFT_470341 [Daldinia caldariorum]
MSEVVDLAGVIGTWVGAGVGVIALIGIVGPVLIWLASRTERQQTLNAMGRETNAYISPGYHLGPNIYLFQRVQAPLLKTFSHPNPSSPATALDSTLLKEVDTNSTWILFSVLIEAYGFNPPRGDSLIVKDRKTYLPVNRLWILYIGLLGRYTTEGDSRRSPSKRNTVFNLPNVTGHRAELQRAPIRSQRLGIGSEVELGSADWPSVTLYGITGNLQIFNQSQRPSARDIPVLVFRPAPINEIRGIQKDTLSPKDLLLLAIGFLPLSESSCVCLTASVNFGSDTDDFEEHRHERRISTRKREPMRSYIRNGPREVNPVELQSSSVGEISNIGSGFLSTRNHTWYGFETINNATAQEAVDHLWGFTYVPTSSDWIRVFDSQPEAYMRRKEAQELALALLKLPCHPEGYLLGGTSRKGTARHLVSMLVRLEQKTDILNLSQQDKQKLNRVLDPALQFLDKENVSPRAFQVIYDLDLVVVGILAITNPEFLVLVRQSLRNISESTNSTVQLDMWSKTLKVPSAFGVFESFIVDWDLLRPDDPRTHEIVEISHTVIALATIRAILRCKMLSICFDADPLISVVGEWEDVIHIQ